MTSVDEQRYVRVDLGARSYDIEIGSGLVHRAGKRIATFASRPRVFIVTDETVAALHLAPLEADLSKAGLTPETFTLPGGESSKSFSNLERVLQWLLEAGAGRDDLLVAFGGGVIGDLTGFAASIMKRGMGLIQIPTTLLAQVDSSVGGKTAVNTAQGKNLVGTFYQPKLVIADTDVLKTLPEREKRAGYAEIIKYGLIDDAPFFEHLEQVGDRVLALDPEAISDAVARSCMAKARIVAQDEREGGVRALLNLGHTFGHAFEAANRYGSELLHGEAVGIGMALALRYSARQGLMPMEDAERARAVIDTSGLKTRMPDLDGGPYRPKALIEHMKQDKKVRGNRVPLILARGIGRSFIHPDADLADVEAFLEEEAGTA
ncbi:MAG: 3-dehydroquinate synthase [Pseudomonadota bacterium]